MGVSVIWVSLPASWSLYNVQAGLQVVIAVICFLGVFVFARTCWQASSLNLAKNRPVLLPALISIHNLSEAFDAVYLLRWRIFHRNHWKILAQCLIVCILSVSTIVSGPIAKASTRVGEIVRPVEVSGLLSNRGFNSYTYGYVQWNETIQKLNSANFPRTELLDFLPDPKYDWVYEKGEWNSSWKMSCSTTPSTQVSISDTGNCKTVFTELIGLETFFPPDNFDYWVVTPFSLYEGIGHTKSALIILNGWTPDIGKSYIGTNKLSFAVAALLMSNLNSKGNLTSSCFFDKGDVGSASYTMAQCEIEKVLNVNMTDQNAAYPDHRDLNAVGQAYISHFSPRVARASASNVSLTPIDPDELIRFYQAYTVSKDTFRQHPVQRTISENIRVPQISATFLALGALIVVLDILGLINVIWFTYKHFDIVWYTPESKLDWAVQSITEPSAQMSHSVEIPTNSHKRFSVVAAMAAEGHVAMRKTNKLRAFFESARYGSHGNHSHESTPLTQYPGPIDRSHSESSMPLYQNPPQTYTGTSHNLTSPEIVSPPEPSLYHMSPFEVQFASQEAGFFSNQPYTNADYVVSDGRGGIRPWNHGGYQRLGRPDA